MLRFRTAPRLSSIVDGTTFRLNCNYLARIQNSIEGDLGQWQTKALFNFLASAATSDVMLKL